MSNIPLVSRPGRKYFVLYATSILGAVVVLAATLFFARYRLLTPAQARPNSNDAQVFYVDPDRLLVIWFGNAILVNKREQGAFLISGDNGIHLYKYILWKRDWFKGIPLTDRVKLNSSYNFVFSDSAVTLTLPSVEKGEPENLVIDFK